MVRLASAGVVGAVTALRVGLGGGRARARLRVDGFSLGVVDWDGHFDQGI